MPDARNSTEAVQANSNTDLPDAFRDQVKRTLTTDLEADQVDYVCSGCSDRCLNPRGSVLHEAGTCLDCHVVYATTGSIRGRVQGRRD